MSIEPVDELRAFARLVETTPKVARGLAARARDRVDGERHEATSLALGLTPP
jgi:hypothetical protein